MDTAGYMLLTLELAGYKPDHYTEAVAEYLVKTQADRGYWKTVSNRPPTEASDFTATYLALRGLRASAGKEQKERAEKRTKAAREWLLKTRPKDTEDRVFRLFALKEAGADEKDVSAAAWVLLKTQRADGGWGRLDKMASDAYATGTALVALHEAGGLATDHPAYVARRRVPVEDAGGRRDVVGEVAEQPVPAVLRGRVPALQEPVHLVVGERVGGDRPRPRLPAEALISW